MIKNKFFVARIIEEGIIENYIHEKIAIDIPLANEMKAANMELAKGLPYAVLVVADPFTSITEETRKHIATEEYRKVTLAKAILVSSLSQRLITNFYMRFNKPKTPTRSFTKRKDAIEWLRQVIIKSGTTSKNTASQS